MINETEGTTAIDAKKSQSELSSHITQQSSELPNIPQFCQIIKTALGALNKNGSTLKIINKYIRERYKLNMAFVYDEFQTKTYTAIRRMLLTKEIVYIKGLYKLNPYGTESNEGICTIANKFDTLIWTAANALDNENGFSGQDIYKYLQDTNKNFEILNNGGFSKAMTFMVASGLINLVRGVLALGTKSAHFKLAKNLPKTPNSKDNEKTNHEEGNN